MIVLLFGVTNVGKTTIGEVLAEKIGYQFYDLDDETKSYYRTTLEDFVNNIPDKLERDQKKGAVLELLMKSKEQNKVIAISPIVYASVFDKYLLWANTIAIELQDSVTNIFDRLVFSDENDQCYIDNEYKNQHKEHYLQDIQDDINYYKPVFKNVRNKININGRLPEEVAEDIIETFKEKIFSENKNGEKVHLPAKFFKQNMLEERTSAMILYFSLIMMRSHELNHILDDATSPFLDEERIAEIEKDKAAIMQIACPEDLVKCMRKSKIIINREYILEKVLSMEEQIMPLIVKRIRNNGQDEFVEIATLALAIADAKYVEDLIENIEEIKYPIARAMVCLALGIKREVQCSELLLKQFYKLPKEYPEQGYENGPLLALYLIYDEFKLM